MDLPIPQNGPQVFDNFLCPVENEEVDETKVTKEDVEKKQDIPIIKYKVHIKSNHTFYKMVFF